MTKEEAIECLKQDIEGNLNGRVNIEKRTLKKILDAFNDEPTDDIPIGAPCEVETKASTQLQYYNGNGRAVVSKETVGCCGYGNDYAHVRPLTIWDIPEKYGGAPEWAIARAYNEQTNVWIEDEIIFSYYENIGYTIERRPEEI
jgi:hypothetical protein